ncbi:hypothetical protein AAG906_002946 [Vitis piasezkii]
MERKVAIVGAGISGILACKCTLSKGYTLVAFESQGSIGSYAHHFNLTRHIEFNSRVVSIEFEGAPEEELQAWELWGGNAEPFSSKGKWRITVENTQRLSTEVYLVEYPCRMLYKTKHWSLPDYQPWGIPLVYMYFNRFSELLVHKPGEGFILKEISSCLITTMPERDLVILATGFKGDEKLKDMFVSPAFKDCILGSPTASYLKLTSEMRCRWVAELLDGTFKLPSTKEMEKDAERRDKYMKQYSGGYYRRSCTDALHIWYMINSGRT